MWLGSTTLPGMRAFIVNRQLKNERRVFVTVLV